MKHTHSKLYKQKCNRKYWHINFTVYKQLFSSIAESLIYSLVQYHFQLLIIYPYIQNNIFFHIHERTIQSAEYTILQKGQVFKSFETVPQIGPKFADGASDIIKLNVLLYRLPLTPKLIFLNNFEESADLCCYDTPSRSILQSAEDIWCT